MSDRLSSGRRRLDDVLNGGLPLNAINMVIGVPGSGKTILSQQYVFHNATIERPGLYFSTVSEPFDKILRYGQSLEFFDAAAVRERRVVYEDLGGVLVKDGLDGVLVTVGRFLKELRPGIVVIDSFKALHAFAKDEGDFREFLHGLSSRFSATAATAIWVGEYGRAEAQGAAEFAVADAIIALDLKRGGDREVRVLQVLKLRGSGFLSGEHSYRISPAGLDVFPRLADPQDTSAYELSVERVSTGVAALDEMLGEGYWAGASTLIVGPSGVGKTLLGLHFIFAGAFKGEPGILATFQENKTQLGRIARSFGWSIDTPGFNVLSRSLVDMYIDEWVYELLDLVETSGSKRIVIDSLPDLMTTAGDPVRFREWMFSLTQRCTRRGISLMMIVEVPELFELRRISEQGLSHLADNVVLLQYVHEDSRLARTVTVLKTRAMHHQPVVRRYDITERGFELGEETSQH
ncbi:MAG TPA: ATPase domain-containing protein [Candidatus Dormibacteraeota bacterium]|nr:ATPase domain-containing protein [Candidatus Dormibacteraeota bacterium]